MAILDLLEYRKVKSQFWIIFALGLPSLFKGDRLFWYNGVNPIL